MDLNHRRRSASGFTVRPHWPLGHLSIFGASEGTRTPDLLITNQLLYQLSYAGVRCVLYNIIAPLVKLRIKYYTYSEGQFSESEKVDKFRLSIFLGGEFTGDHFTL